jgi:hypothetical protein
VLPSRIAEVYRRNGLSGLGNNVIDFMPKLRQKIEYQPPQVVPQVAYSPGVAVQRDSVKSQGKEDKGGNSGSSLSVTIAKIADSVVIREESDIERVADKLATKVLRAYAAGA